MELGLDRQPASRPADVSDRLQVAVFASGAGSTFAALADACASREVGADVTLLIVSREGVPAAALAAARSIECLVLDERVIGTGRCDVETLAALGAREIDLVILAGYLRKIGPKTLNAFAGRMINTHPAPLPRFGGLGMYGQRVHEAVLASGVRESAASLHLVDPEYDTGPIIAEVPVPVLAGDDVSTLQARVQAAERELLIETVAEQAAKARAGG